MVVLNVEGAGVPAFVHTIWPAAKKPRPVAQPVPLVRIKTFRATILVEKVAAEGLGPTEVTGVFGPEDVVAIMDVQEADIDRGIFILTPQSMQMLAEIKSAPLELEGQVKKTRKRKNAAQAEDAPAKPLSATSFKAIAHRLRKMGAVREKKRDGEAPVQVTADDIRRSDKGRQVIRRLVAKAVELDLVHFKAGKPLFDPVTQMCTLKDLQTYKYADFISHVPLHFQFKFFSIRNAESYGRQVYSELASVLDELRSDPPSRKSLIKLIIDCRSAKLEGSIQI